MSVLLNLKLSVESDNLILREKYWNNARVRKRERERFRTNQLSREIMPRWLKDGENLLLPKKVEKIEIEFLIASSKIAKVENLTRIVFILKHIPK